MKAQKKKVKPVVDQRQTKTAFILMLPGLLVGLIAAAYAQSMMLSFIVVALVFYQFMILQEYIKDYYKLKG